MSGLSMSTYAGLGATASDRYTRPLECNDALDDLKRLCLRTESLRTAKGASDEYSDAVRILSLYRQAHQLAVSGRYQEAETFLNRAAEDASGSLLEDAPIASAWVDDSRALYERLSKIIEGGSGYDQSVTSKSLWDSFFESKETSPAPKPQPPRRRRRSPSATTVTASAKRSSVDEEDDFYARLAAAKAARQAEEDEAAYSSWPKVDRDPRDPRSGSRLPSATQRGSDPRDPRSARPALRNEAAPGALPTQSRDKALLNYAYRNGGLDVAIQGRSRGPSPATVAGLALAGVGAFALLALALRR